ncbi:MAG: TldD/PmbA family protein [Candidatus Methylomirabilales bacterium]
MTASAATIELIGELKAEVADHFRRQARRLGCKYADLRLEVVESQFAWAENGHCKQSGRDDALAFGIRVLAGDDMSAPGYYGQGLGAADRDRLGRIIRNGLGHAHARAVANARGKTAARTAFPGLAGALWDTRLGPVPAHQDTLPAVYEVDPRSVPLAEIVALTRDAGSALQVIASITYTSVGAVTQISRELFVNTEGAVIDQAFALTQGTCYVVAQEDSVTQELFDSMGHQRGWEVLTRGVQDPPGRPMLSFPDFRAFATALADDAVKLTRAKPAPTTDGEVTVVLDPHFTALLAHEIIGHPTELDRALKMETGYAGRSWLLRSLDETQIGKQIASSLVTAFSDPALPGFGHYRYDDEGVPARRVVHIDRGIFQGFMNSRQTAAIFGGEPNGHWMATDPSLVPLIRMSNTVFAGGDRDPRDIIQEVDHGYYLVGHRTPSIAESRENFRISAMKVYEIRQGELGQMFRDGGIMADSQAFLMQVDAVGNDFRLTPIPNCGKGQPMQTKRVGNGGPTLRSRAILTGASA